MSDAEKIMRRKAKRIELGNRFLSYLSQDISNMDTSEEWKSYLLAQCKTLDLVLANDDKEDNIYNS